MPTNLTWLTSILVLVLGMVTACSSESASPAMRIEKRCLRTACDARSESDQYACSRCLDACSSASYSCDSSSSCDLSCSPGRACREDERSRCVSEGFEVSAPPESNPTVQTACERMFDRLPGCTRDLADGRSKAVCEWWSKYEKEITAQYYDCVASKGCGGDWGACSLPPSTLGDAICGGLAAKCGSPACDDDDVKLYNANGNAWKDDVTAAARACLDQPTCQDARDCVSAWRGALNP